MKKESLLPPESYLLEPGLLDRVGMILKERGFRGKAALVSDERVFSLYGPQVLTALRRADFSVSVFVFPPGERSKNLETYGKILEQLAADQLERSHPLLALGGGVSGDLGGFAAASYRRGMPLIQLPTSLLAMADSCWGGKCGVDLKAGKNLAGAFYPPVLVLADPDCLRTLPPEEIQNGLGEIIKCGLLGDPLIFDLLEKANPDQLPTELILRALLVKDKLVREDPLEKGPRQLLNLGHSLGHAMEFLSGYTLAHGQAVAAGMAVISRSACARGLLPEADLLRLLKLLKKYKLPQECGFSAGVILPLMTADKKVRDGRLNLVVPEALGVCRLIPVPIPQVKEWLNAGGVL